MKKESNLKVSLLSLFLLVFITVNIAQNSYREEGKASYYSDRMQGRRTSTGERYNKKAFTAAHATLPLGTIVVVTNKKNNKSVTVKINDRCSKHAKRIIDVSKAAAKELDMIQDGMVSVIIEEAESPNSSVLPQTIAPKDSLLKLN